MSFATTTTLSVAQGQARDSTGLNDIVLSLPPQNDGTAITTAFTIDSALSGAGGLDTGTIGNSTHYAVYVIASSSNSAINLPPSTPGIQSVPPFAVPSTSDPVVQDGYFVQTKVMISASFTSPLLPFGYDMFRRIGAVLTDGSALFLAFDQDGSSADRTITYRASIATDVTAGSSSSYAAVDVSGSVPVASVKGLFKVTFTPTAGDDPIELRSGDSAAAGDSQAVLSGSVAAVVKIGMLSCPIGATLASGIDYKVTGSAVAVNVQGYIDVL